MEAFEILFDDNPSNVYHQGEVLNGHVKILLAGQKKITELSVTFRGEASTYTSWLHKRGTNLTAEQCGASETYFDEYLTIINDEKILKSGANIFPFKFTIPSHLNLPASFEGDHGHVKYFVSARLNSYLYAKKIFTVIGGQAAVLDMDSLLSAMAPVSRSSEKVIPHLCCFPSTITLFAQTDKKGYVPGENIILCGSIVNHSHRQINQLCTRLVQKAMYANCTEFPMGETQRVLVEEMYEMCCDRSCSVPFSNKLLAVPSCVPSGLPGCEVIDIKYFVHIEAEASVWMPIDIGSSQDSLNLLDIHTTGQSRKTIPSIVVTSQEDQLDNCSNSITERHSEGDAFQWPDPPEFATPEDLKDQLELIPLTPLNKDLNIQSSSSLQTSAPAPLQETWQSSAVPILAPPEGFTDEASLMPISEEDELPLLAQGLPTTGESENQNQNAENSRTTCSPVHESDATSNLLVNMQIESCQTVVAEEFSFLSFDYF
ncbi:arrestin domain-containing protein 17-like [Amphiura filiformis]|uniref:arrestin domain-containing protein 17-like n=1 Tax=Amphiura filiformis TaxID=82378 RepID=UPI003B22501B